MNVTTNDRETDLRARVAWSRMAEPGDAFANELIDLLGAAPALEAVLDPERNASLARSLTKTLAEGEVQLDVDERFQQWIARHNTGDADRDIDKAISSGFQTVLPGDEHWPAQLDDLSAARPFMLWVRGDVSLLATKSVAIVGARAATGYGEHVTMEIAAHLADAGVTVISGAAYGIDGMAHRSVLASGGKTIAVLASGLDRAYPTGHAALIERIAETGALVSEFPPGTVPTKHRFSMRARLIAALSGAIVVTEAGYRSGSLITVSFTEFFDRPVGAVPGPITSAASAGSNNLIRDRAAVLVTSGADVLALLVADEETQQQLVELIADTAEATEKRAQS